MVGPLTCLWSDLLDNNLVANESVIINAHDVLYVVQGTLVLMGNTNELLSQTHRHQILQCANKNLEKYFKDPRPNSQEYHFGEEFCSQLKSKVELDTALSQFVSLLECLMASVPMIAASLCFSTASNSFFKGAMPGK